jgi:thiamine-monophosphate kinase
MTLRELGGEFELIRRITRSTVNDPNVVKGIGDDCAVIRKGDGKLLLVTTDMMVEKDHFNITWSTPAQIGMKLMECNVSDIVAKGGEPKYAFLSICITKDTTVEFMDGFYDGLYASADEHGVLLLGGDTTHGSEYNFSLTLIGEVEESLLRLRSHALPGDLICVTGTLGGSTAGLKLLLHGKSGYLSDHLEPKSRKVEEGKLIASLAHATIDVSDGLGSEVRHIAEESGTGARIDFDSIPLSPTTRESASMLGLDPYDFALYGGEDFEIVFTITRSNVETLRSKFTDFSVVGQILDKKEGVYIFKDGKREPLKKGYDHFA